MAGNNVQIDINNVSKSYPMGAFKVDALKGVDLKISKGELWVVLGPSGSGKTTLLNLIGGIDSASSGRITVGAIEITSLDERDLNQYRRENIGFIFQFFNLIPTLTAGENIELAAELVDKPRDIMAVLSDVGLGDRAGHFPSELSGGEQQRVAIARALVNNPSLILADEPTGNLDSSATAEIISIFCQLNKEGITIVLVTHEPDVAAKAERIIRLLDGQIIEDKKI